MTLRATTTLGLLLALLACGEGDADAAPAPDAAAPRQPAPPAAALLDPEDDPAHAPGTFVARFEIAGGGHFDVEVHRAWAPNGADRFHELVRLGFFDGVPFHRVVKTFMVQFGIHPDPAVNAVWQERTIPDDPVVKANRRGTVTFAQTGAPDSRSVQVFVNYVANVRLDRQGFAPFGRVIAGMEHLDALFDGYGEMASQGNPDGIDAGRLVLEGERYLESFPGLDRIARARILPPSAEGR